MNSHTTLQLGKSFAVENVTELTRLRSWY